MNIPPFAVVITAAGKSERFSKGEVKKEFLKLDGHTVLYRATEPFLEVPGLSAIVVVTREGSEDETAVALEELADINGIPFLIISGGESRTSSVKRAIATIKNLPLDISYIAIHDGARPYVTPDDIIRTLAAAAIYGSAAPAIRVLDAVKRIDGSGAVTEAVSRTGLVRVQTPQIFEAKAIERAYEKLAEDEVYDDDIDVFMKAGNKAYLSQGSKANIKITYLSDIPDAEKQIESYIKDRESGRSSKRAIERMRALMNQREEE